MIYWVTSKIPVECYDAPTGEIEKMIAVTPQMWRLITSWLLGLIGIQYCMLKNPLTTKYQKKKPTINSNR